MKSPSLTDPLTKTRRSWLSTFWLLDVAARKQVSTMQQSVHTGSPYLYKGILFGALQHWTWHGHHGTVASGNEHQLHRFCFSSTQRGRTREVVHLSSSSRQAGLSQHVPVHPYHWEEEDEKPNGKCEGKWSYSKSAWKRQEKTKKCFVSDINIVHS